MKTRILSFSLFFLLFVSIINLNAEPRKMLLEFCTGTWCGYCPCGDAAAEQILSSYPQTVVIAYHGASTDPWQNFNGSDIRALLDFHGYPTGIFDRTNYPGNGGSHPYITYNMWSGLASARYSNAPNSQVHIAITNSSYNAGTRQLSVSLNATALQDLTGQYKIVYVLTEDNVVYPQNFYSSCGTPGYHNDYVHKWIARNVVNGSTGENLNSGTWNLNQSISKSVSTTIDNAWVDGNCNLNIIVYRDSSESLDVSTVEQGSVLSLAGLVGITGNNNSVPKEYTLSQNYPNPFNPTTNIKFAVPRDGNASLKIYDILGNLVAVYYDGFLRAGSYNAEVDAANLASGIYFYTLRAGNFIETKKMSLIK
jgi:hypothetical protein